MPRTDKLSGYKTTISQHTKHTVVTYHTTAIVQFNQEEIILNFGGWDTVTTRRKMNQASNQFNLGYSVYRDKGQTYVSYGSSLNRTPYCGKVILLTRDLLGNHYISHAA